MATSIKTGRGKVAFSWLTVRACCTSVSLLVISLRCCSLAILSCSPSLMIVLRYLFFGPFFPRCFDRDGDGIAIWAEPAWECQFHPTDDLFSLVGTTAH